MAFRLANVNDRAALVQGDHYFDVEGVSGGSLPSDPMALLTRAAELSALSERLGSATPTGRVADVVLGPPVPRPQKSFGIGLNYKSHADESSMELPANPLVFTKFPSCIVGPTADIEMRGDAVDYEGELVVVIGTKGKDIPVDKAWDHVVGLTIGQDVSDRRVQFSAKPPHFDLGKSFDTYGPIGPVLVSTDSFADRNRLQLTTLVNGEQRQSATTDALIFDIPYLVSYLSRITTLVPGDVIFTGTPDGVGATTKSFLRDGDVVTTTIEGIGTMTNRCIRVSDFVAG